MLPQAVARKTRTEETGVAWDNMLKRGTVQKLIEKLDKEVQYYEFSQLKDLFENPTSLIFALANGASYGKNSALYKLIEEIYNDIANGD